jgi:phospholipase C
LRLVAFKQQLKNVPASSVTNEQEYATMEPEHRVPTPRPTRVAPILLAPLLATAWPGPVAAAPTFSHIVIIFQENRTPDNLFGSNPTFEPGVDIVNTGLAPEPLDDCYDIAHTHASFEDALHKGFGSEPTSKPKGCTLPLTPQFKYVDNSSGTVQPYFDIATNYGFSNRMFQTNQGPSFPAHQFIFGGTSQPAVDSDLFAAENMNLRGATAGCTARADQTVNLIDGSGSETSKMYPCFEHPTLVDLLGAATPLISWRYHAPAPGSIWTAPDAIQHICVPGEIKGKLKCTGPDWTNGDVVPNDPAQVLKDISKCALRGVSWVIPTAAESDHAGVNNGTGPQWVASIVNAIGNAPCPASNGETYWDNTAIIITWDDWGGWYDHVAPFQINIQPTDPLTPTWGDGYTYGFRVPMLVVSAYTQPATVSNNIYDFGSILYFIELNFGLGFIGGSDMTTYGQYADYYAQSRGNLSEFFTLGSPRGFVSIPTKMKAKDFIEAPRSMVGPDND